MIIKYTRKRYSEDVLTLYNPSREISGLALILISIILLKRGLDSSVINLRF